MKKGIKANLYLPKDCLEILNNKRDEVIDFFENFINLQYDIYLGEYQEIEVCAMEFIMVNKTASLVNEDYRRLKWFLKDITNKQPKQILMIKFDRF